MTRNYNINMCDSELESFVNTKILSNHFKEMCLNYLPPFRETSPWMNRQKGQINQKVVFFLSQVARLIREEKVDGETFKNEIKRIKDLNVLHVEILWYLQIAELLTLTEFIEFHERDENERVIEHISGRVFENLLAYRPNSSEIREAMLADFAKTFFECSKRRTEYKVSFFRKLMSLITSNLLQYYKYEDYDIDRCIEISHLMKLFQNAKLHDDDIKLFLQLLTKELLESPVQTFKSVFKMQERVKNQLEHKKIFQFFKAISRYCDLEFLIGELSTALMNASNGLNWDYMLCFITFVGQSYKDGWSKLKALSSSVLTASFQSLDARLLSNVFLIARQGCFEKVNSSFPSYIQWFSSTFSSESRRPLNTRKICSFFFDFLTETLPCDSAYYLKVHINRVPWVPLECLPILNDYVALVKTQLCDLNVSTELGICENLTNKSAAVFDVENVMQHFERTNNILSSVFQASMFCKEYYEKKFLAELLKRFDGKKSTRHKLIMKLHSLGKIPNSIFKAYKALERK